MKTKHTKNHQRLLLYLETSHQKFSSKVTKTMCLKALSERKLHKRHKKCLLKYRFLLLQATVESSWVEAVNHHIEQLFKDMCIYYSLKTFISKNKESIKNYEYLKEKFLRNIKNIELCS